MQLIINLLYESSVINTNLFFIGELYGNVKAYGKKRKWKEEKQLMKQFLLQERSANQW